MKQTNPPKYSKAKWYKRFITWPLEGLGAWVLVNTLKLIPIDTASNLTGSIARRLGPCLPVSNRARNNLQNCFPDWTKTYIETVLSDMWENCGRIIGEYPHIQDLDVSGNDKRIKVDGIEHIKSMRDDNAPGIVFSAHLGNWELLPMLAQPNGLEMNFVYRALNSPSAEKVLRKTRNKLSPVSYTHLRAHET